MSRSDNEDKVVKDTLHLIKQGWMKLDSQCSNLPNRDVVFVLGGTGAGKSSVTQVVTGDLKRLHAKFGQHGSGLVIVDEAEEGSGGRIGNPQVASKTFLPEYLPCEDDGSTSADHLVFVDCPGFEDNRGTSMEIAAMVLIKKIAEQVDHARFLFVIPSSSVSFTDMNRNAFSRLCSSATEFVKDVDKVKDSISLVINKVNNHDPSTGAYVEDQDVIRNTSLFLEQVSKLQHSSIENQSFIEYLLSDFSKWVLIHYPTRSGPLSDMAHFAQVRHKIRDICRHRLKKTKVTSNDFAVTLSPESRYIIGKRLVPHMKSEIDKIVQELITNIKADFVVRFEKELETSQTTQLVSLVENLETICEKLREAEELRAADSFAFPVTSKITMIAEWIQINLAQEKMKELKKIEEQLQMFQTVTEETDTERERGSSVQITSSINSLKTRLLDLHKCTLKTVKVSIIPCVESRVKDETQTLVRNFTESYKKTFWSCLENGDEFGYRALEKLNNDWSKFEILERDGLVDEVSGGKLGLLLTKIGEDLHTPIKTDLLDKLQWELELLLKLTEQPYRFTEYAGGIILPEISKFLQSVLTEAQKIVRNKYIGIVQQKIQVQVSNLICTLENTFFEEVFYVGLRIDTMAEKRELLAAINASMQRVIFNGIVTGISEIFQIFAYKVPENTLASLKQCEEILEFYDMFLKIPSRPSMEEFTKSVRSLQQRIHELNILYEFLELAKNTNPNMIEQDLKLGEEDEDKLILKFLEALRATSDIRRIVEKRATAQDKELIRSIAKYLGSGKTHLTLGFNDDMVVKGRNVKFSEFLNEDGVPCGRSVRKVLVLAGDSVHLDRDVKGEGSQLTITLIADKWVVEGRKRSILLSGIDGFPHHKQKADNGYGYGKNGLNGLPGNCGGNGGNFFGIYNELENGEGLSIYADGGNGGDGQGGGNGADGMPAAEIKDNTTTVERVGRALTSVALPFLPNPFTPRRRVKEGGKGGDGGDGGAGGEPGLEGIIKLFPMTNEVSISKLSNKKGMRGQPGKGGSGGLGGMNDDLGFGVCNSKDDMMKTSGGCFQRVPRGPDGKDGRTGGCRRGRITPSPQTIQNLDWRDVEAYRKYIMEECQLSVAGSRLLQLIDNHPGLSRR